MIGIPFYFLTNFDAYKNPAGLISAATAIPYFILMAGSIALLANRRTGYPMIYVGAVLTTLGTVWSFIPFVPALFDTLETKFVVILIGNLFVLSFLIWCQIKEKDSNTAHGAV